MISTLVSGTLINKPVERTSSNGNGRKFVTAQIRAAADGESFVLSLIAFNETVCKLLLALDKGDDVCVAGPGKPSSWTGKDGAPAFGLSIVAQQLMTQYRLREKRKASEQRSESLMPAPEMLTKIDSDDAPF